MRRLLASRFEENQASLARAIHRAPATVWRLLTDGDHAKRIGEALARDIERELQLAPYWLDGAAQVVRSESTEVPDLIHDGAPRRGPYAVPIISFESATRRFTGARDEEEALGVIYGNEAMSTAAYALVVRGEAMWPDYMEGDRVFVDPEASPVPGDVVVALIADRDLVIRKYRPISDSLFELTAKNPDYANINCANVKCKITGVVVEHHRFRRGRLRQ